MKVIFNLLKTEHIDTNIYVLVHDKLVHDKFRLLNETDCALLEKCSQFLSHRAYNQIFITKPQNVICVIADSEIKKRRRCRSSLFITRIF